MIASASFFTLIIAIVAIHSPRISSAEILEARFTTRLDHGRAQDLRTASFIYHSNLDHYQYGGPFYINIKDVADTSTRWIEDSLMVDMAADTNAALFTFDNRFFGTNIPTENLSLNNLQYLEFEQMLADISMFITHLHNVMQTRNVNNDVILFGAGTGGTLAAWARKKFPHLVDFAWSSSGIFEVALSSFRALDTLEYVIMYANPASDCRTSMSTALTELDQLINAGNSDRIRAVLNLCSPIDTNDVQEVAFLYQSLYNFIMRHLDQNHMPGLNRLCDVLENLNTGESNLDAFGRWLNANDNGECRDTNYYGFVESLSNANASSVAARSGARQSIYLQCTQSALFQITDDLSWVPNRIEFTYHNVLCRHIFAEEGYDFAGVWWANHGLINSFGSFDQTITNMLYTNGELDSFKSNGIIYTYDEGSSVLNIPNYAKSADFPSIQESDSEVLVAYKVWIQDIIHRWHGHGL